MSPPSGKRRETSTLLGPLGRANPSHWTHAELLDFWTLTIVRNSKYQKAKFLKLNVSAVR
jgi:hypothetical protein